MRSVANIDKNADLIENETFKTRLKKIVETRQGDQTWPTYSSDEQFPINLPLWFECVQYGKLNGETDYMVMMVSNQALNTDNI